MSDDSEQNDDDDDDDEFMLDGRTVGGDDGEPDGVESDDDIDGDEEELDDEDLKILKKKSKNPGVNVETSGGSSRRYNTRRSNGGRRASKFLFVSL